MGATGSCRQGRVATPAASTGAAMSILPGAVHPHAFDLGDADRQAGRRPSGAGAGHRGRRRQAARLLVRVRRCRRLRPRRISRRRRGGEHARQGGRIRRVRVGVHHEAAHRRGDARGLAQRRRHGIPRSGRSQPASAPGRPACGRGTLVVRACTFSLRLRLPPRSAELVIFAQRLSASVTKAARIGSPRRAGHRIESHCNQRRVGGSTQVAQLVRLGEMASGRLWLRITGWSVRGHADGPVRLAGACDCPGCILLRYVGRLNRRVLPVPRHLEPARRIGVQGRHGQTRAYSGRRWCHRHCLGDRRDRGAGRPGHRPGRS